MRRALLCLVALGGTILWAQETVQVSRAELSVPFGTVKGKIVTMGDRLVFVDDDRPEASFALNRADVESARVENGLLNVQLRRPIRDREGERTRLSMRLDGGDPETVVRWANAAGVPAVAASDSARLTSGAGAAVAGGAVTTSGATLFNIEARHEHRLRGNCRGRLVLTEAGLSFQSLTELTDSRQWGFRDIKELRHGSPYELTVEPFDGAMYRFEMQGSGMDNDQFKLLSERVAAARAVR